MTGTPWHVAVMASALLIFLVGLATALRGPDWPVMGSRYDAPEGHGSSGGQAAGPGARSRALDAATMWESLNGGEDPTEYEAADDRLTGSDPADEHAAADRGAQRERKTNA
jgi:hypothetical protein